MPKIRRSPLVQLLANSPFRNLVLGNYTNMMGVELRIMAQSWLILELGASQVWVGAATGLRVVPAIAIGLFAGVMVDRMGGRYVLLVERLLLLLLAVVTAAVVVSDVVTLWQIVVLSIVSSAVLAMGMPAGQSLVATLLAKEKLQSGNSLNMAAVSLARGVGPLAGGFLIAGFGLGSPFLALIGLYALSVYFTTRLPKEEVSEPSGDSALREIIDGLKYIRSNPVLFRVMLIAFSVILSAVMVPIMPVYARDRFDVGETGYGTMLAAWAVGQGVSALWIASRENWARKTPPILISSVVFVAADIVFALSTNFYLTLASLVAIGAAIPVWASSTITLLQLQSDPKMLGRVMSVFSLSLQSMMFGWFLGAWIGTIIGNAQMIVISTLIYLFVNFVIILTSKELRKL